MSPWTRSIASLGLALALVGCGGSQASPAVGATFAAQAVAVCSAASASKEAWQPFPVAAFDPSDPDPALLDEVGPWLEGVVAPTFQGWRDGLVALGDPPSGAGEWKDVLSAVDTITDGNEDQIAAARAGDPAAFAAATTALQGAQPSLVAATEAAGVAACAEVHAD